MQFEKKNICVFFEKKNMFFFSHKKLGLQKKTCFFSHKKLGLQKNTLKSVFFNTHLKEITR